MTDEDPGRSLFAGGGEVGRAMAETDWSQTPLGPPEQWPSGLRHTVRILLTSRFAMWAGWGPELFFFYNDAYRHDTLQTKHPWALGRPASEVWAEIWPDIAPRTSAVLDSGVATWDEDLLLFLERSGYPEETYHTFSYSPLPGDDGGNGGLLCVVTETTQQVVGERRMATLRDLAAALGAARSEAGVFAAVEEQLGRNPADLPFSAVYLLDDDGAARLRCATGLEPGSTAPSVVVPGGAHDEQLRRVLAGEDVVVDGLDRRRPDLPTGAWQVPPVQAVALPIASSAQDRGPVAGFLVVGLNPHRRWDDAYRGFLGLVANQISSALANAGSYEAERRRAEALAELDRAKTDFFSNVSHEFRTPLTLIAGPVAELRASPAAMADPRLREELEVIERNAQRLHKLVNTLLDFSRIQAGRIDARFEPVDLAATTAELASVFRSAVVRAGLTFTVDCPPLHEPVHVDRDMWEKVVLNLLSNALKFTPTGGITVRLRQDGDGARLTVSDTGTGIAADELPRLFERFHRVADARGRSGEGSGIGLAMVRELVALHGGSIDVDSTPGAGTTFTVTLPLGTAHLPADRLAEPAGDASAVSPAAVPFVTEALRWLPDGDVADLAPPSRDPAGSSGRVLVADDNADMRGYLLRLLGPHYDVRAVPDGRQALDAALADPPDLVVSDVMMPELDGVGLLAALRAEPRTARIPVVLLSARAGEEAAVEGLAAGADDYLVKPFSAQELLARVGAHLELGRARRAAEERFTAMADLAPALIWVADPDGRRVFVNRGWTEFTGRPAHGEVGDGWTQGLHPEDRDRYAEVVAAASARREGWEVDVRLRRADGTYHWLLERAVPIGAGETFAGHVGSCTDINARIRETARQTLLAEVGTALDRETTVDGQLGALARLLVDRRLADLCTVRLRGDDGRLRFAGIAALDRASEAALAALDPHSGLGLDVLATGRPVLRAGLPRPDASVDRPEPGWPHSLLSAMAVPLTVRGQLRAVLALGRQSAAPPYDDDDRMLLEEVAGRAALAVDNAVLLAEERAAAQRLTLLQRATAELSAATTPVEVAEVAGGHVHALTGPGSRVAVYEVDPSHRALSALAIGGGSPAGLEVWRTVPMSAPLVATTAVLERRPVWVEDVAAQPPSGRELAPELAASAEEFGLAAVAALPLSAAGRVVGVLSIAWPRVQRFSATDRAMLLAVAEQCAQALDRARLYRAERGIAETLQLSLLPAQLPALERLALAAHYLPGAEGTQAGGDWYDVVELADSRIAIAVGDVVGQGPAAAAVMGQLRSALSAALLQGCGPAQALELLDLFAARLPGALASTAACLVVDGAAGTVRWARAGHPPALLVTPDGAQLLDGAGSGAVLGAPGRRPYTEGTADIAPGATLLLYTDGLVERRGEVLDDGLERVRAAAARHAAADPLVLTGRLLAEVLADADQPDDVALIAARLVPEPLTARLPADPRRLSPVRRAVTAWAAAAGLPDDTTEDLQLALGEALANAVEHAYAASPDDGECSCTVARDAAGGVRVEVCDTGVWRPPPADRGYRGRGLELISALATEVEVVHAPEVAGTTVRFRLAPAVPGPHTRTQRGTASPAPDGSAALTLHEEPGGPRLELHGEVDLATAGRVRQQLFTRLEQLAPGTVATLDLRPTGYLASAGVGLVLEAVVRARGAGVELRVQTQHGTPPARILALAGVDDQAAPAPAAPFP